MNGWILSDNVVVFLTWTRWSCCWRRGCGQSQGGDTWLSRRFRSGDGPLWWQSHGVMEVPGDCLNRGSVEDGGRCRCCRLCGC